MTTTPVRPSLRLVPPSPPPSEPEIPAPRPPTRDVEPVGDGATPGEIACLPCYVDRMVAREGCDQTLRWALRWRDSRAPRAAKLGRRLEDRGGYCDCEVLMNAFRWHFPEDSDEPDGEARPPCRGRRRGAAMDPCRPPLTPYW